MHNNDRTKTPYYDPSANGNSKTTLADAREIGSSIKLGDVNMWFLIIVFNKRKIIETQSCVSNCNTSEYQTDVCHSTFRKYDIGMISIDALNKYCAIFLIKW